VAIRISALSVPRFRHGGIEVGPSWVEVKDPTPVQIATLREFHGRFIQVHRDDRAKLAGIGLRFEGPNKPLVEAKPEPAKAAKK